MFVTFYSYKGGVGRSLALANVACLLAQDSEHPQRVLLWDFDLDAPGLHKLFPPKTPQSFGFIDLARTWASTQDIPRVSDYIYHSTVDGVDVLQAGSVNESYCSALEDIDWSGFFSEDPTDPGPFFGPLMESIKSSDYDYVLIDSRTGLGDQAGICTQVLPDLLVVLFRLNEQNLDGLEHFIPVTLDQWERRERGSRETLPIASVVTTTASEAVSRLRARAGEIFRTKDLDYIRFDPDLVTEERLFCRHDERERVWPTPYIVADYEKVRDLIRQRNDADTQTQAAVLRRQMRTDDYASAGASIQTLLPRRPRLRPLWTTLDNLYSHRGIGKSASDKLVASVLDADSTNPYAARWRALRFLDRADSPASAELSHAVEELKRALKHSSEHDQAELLRILARAYSCQGDLEGAEHAFRKWQELLPGNAQILNHLAGLHLRMGMDHFTEAVEELEKLPGHIDGAKYRRLAYLRAFLGQPEKAEEALDSWREAQEAPEWRGVVEAHVRVIQGRQTEAIEAAEMLLEETDPHYSAANWGELLFCAEAFERALEVLRSAEAGDDGLAGLIGLVEYIQDGSLGREQTIKEWKRHQTGWSFDELILFRERAKRDGHPELAQRLEIVEDLIRIERVREGAGREGQMYWIPSGAVITRRVVR